ncbi:MAG: glycosyltransferase [Methanobacterium sp.]|jgi:glycosyltransferase involved in cell wall biosynthesis
MKKRILILVESLKVGGGSERVGATLGTKLHDKDYEISYLTLMDENPKFKFKGDYYTLNEDDIYKGNNLKRGFNLLKYSYKIKTFCKDLNIDTIISVGEVANFHAVLSRWLFKNNVHIIISQHMSPEIFLDNKVKYQSIKFFYPRADETVCVSKDTERILNECYGIQNTQTIYNMMNLKENIKLSIEELPKKYKELFKGNYNFINVGRLTRQKGQWFLIRSFRKVVDQHENARLFILGDGTLKNELKELINKLNLNEKVFLLNIQENVFPFLKNSDCFIFSSLWEGLPIVLIEALSMNLPIISTDCKTGPREILCPELDLKKEINYRYYCKYGILNQPFNDKLLFKNLEEAPLDKSENMMSDIMIKIIEDPILRKKYSNGQKMSEKFDEEEIMKKWEKLLKK